MTLVEEFEIRVEEIEIYFAFTEQLNIVETHKQNQFTLYEDIKLDIKRDLQKVIRANCFLMLYNLIEATIRSNLWAIFDAIIDDSITYDTSSEKIKNYWLTQKAYDFNETSNINKIKEKLKKIIEAEDNNVVEINKERISISGNLDYRVIENTLADFGIHGRISISDKKKLARVLLKIKSERNALGHGNKSFRKSAEMVTVKDLLEHKDLTIQYLRDITNNTVTYIDQKKYKKI